MALSLLFGSALSLPAQTFVSGPAAVPLLELYTSEGCSSCPPAEAWLSGLVNEPGLWRDFVPVAFHVNYWDRLGWKDALATPANTERQYAYAEAWQTGGRVYTPGFVWAGREWRPGQSEPRPAVTEPGVLTVARATDGSVTVDFMPGEGVSAEGLRVHVAWLGAGVVSRVRAGENAGRELIHDFVVLHLAEPASLRREATGRMLARWPEPGVEMPAVKRKALVAWVSRDNSPGPLQAVGGWLTL